MKVTDTPKFCGAYRRIRRKSNAGRSIGVAVLVGVFVLILIVAAVVL
jgi:hypothetical protein